MSFLLTRRLPPLALAASVAGLQMVIPCLDAFMQRAKADPTFEQRVLDVIRRHPSVLIEALNAYEQEQQVARGKAQSAHLRRLYPQPNDLIGQAPRRGNGQVVLIMFSDFQCPYCAQAHRVLTDLLKRRGQSLSVVYKHVPLSQIHPQALPAARAAWAAGRQDQFWAYHDALFANQSRLGEPLYREIAQGLGLDLKRFDQDRRSSAALQAMRTDLDQAERLGISGTPTLVMDQNVLTGPTTVEELGKQLDAALAALGNPRVESPPTGPNQGGAAQTFP